MSSSIDLAARMVELTENTAEPAEPELLPVRLARACTEVLRVDGAGLSLFTDPDLRIPIGASEESATVAERLQFTVGDGPCFAAHSQGRPVIATEDVLARSWPVYYRELVARTPYRGIVSVPLHEGLDGMGALDLYLCDSSRAASLSSRDVWAVADAVTASLTDMPHDRGEGDLPDWLGNPQVKIRSKVWIAIGILNLSLAMNSPDSLAVLRAYSHAHGRTVDDTADDLCSSRVRVDELLAD